MKLNYQGLLNLNSIFYKLKGHPALQTVLFLFEANFNRKKTKNHVVLIDKYDDGSLLIKSFQEGQSTRLGP